ncbi:effector-associated constant component EACC1 [Nocardia takedensis]|uniref:effector-associated constant component EACC1 n=1 Tax=Nocardia takedensis TaxID=259390 RepID=UPI003F759099
MSNSQVQLLIRGVGGVDGVVELLETMRFEDALRGHVRQRPTMVRPDEMGAVSDALVLTVGSGGAVGIAAALVRSLNVWFTHRRSAMKLTLTAADGTSITIEAGRVDTPEVLQEIQKLLEAARSER